MQAFILSVQIIFSAGYHAQGQMDYPLCLGNWGLAEALLAH